MTINWDLLLKQALEKWWVGLRTRRQDYISANCLVLIMGCGYEEECLVCRIYMLRHIWKSIMSINYFQIVQDKVFLLLFYKFQIVQNQKQKQKNKYSIWLFRYFIRFWCFDIEEISRAFQFVERKKSNTICGANILLN